MVYIYFCFCRYIFDVKNPEDVVHNASKPILEEVGPIKLRYRYLKYNVKFMQNNEIARYGLKSQNLRKRSSAFTLHANNNYRFMLWEYYTVDNDERTHELLKKNVTTINVPYLITQGFAPDLKGFACLFEGAAFEEAQSQLLKTRTIHVRV